MSRCLRMLYFYAIALFFFLPSGCAPEGKTIVVGGKNFTEQYILVELARTLLEKEGFTVIAKTGVGSIIARKSLESGQIDLYYEYTGTAYTVYHKQSDPRVMSNPDRCYRWVKDADAKKGLIWLDPIRFNNTYTLIMKMARARALGIESIGDLAHYVKSNPRRLTFAVNSEFWERPDGFKKLMEVYRFSIDGDSVKKMETGLTYMALKNEDVDVAMGFSTDGRISAFGFVDLIDDKGFFPVYSPAPVVREPTLRKYPGLRRILAPIAEKLTTREMRLLNAAVDIEHKGVREVAAAWLKKKGVI